MLSELLPNLAAGHCTGTEPHWSCSRPRHNGHTSRRCRRRADALCRRAGTPSRSITVVAVASPLSVRRALPLSYLSCPVHDCTERRRCVDVKASEAVRPSSHIPSQWELAMPFHERPRALGYSHHINQWQQDKLTTQWTSGFTEQCHTKTTFGTEVQLCWVENSKRTHELDTINWLSKLIFPIFGKILVNS